METDGNCATRAFCSPTWLGWCTLQGGHSAKLPHKAAPGSTQQPQQRIPALWNENVSC